MCIYVFSQTVIPILKYVRGEHLSPDHWLDLFRLLGLPRGTSLEKLLFGDLLRVADMIVAKASDLKVGFTFINNLKKILIFVNIWFYFVFYLNSKLNIFSLTMVTVFSYSILLFLVMHLNL